ncbi:glutamate 5-kinase [Candidatus Woesearchaeota archaeon]|nr:glutamate 5-kinase [Candidatus Woesearchaeota archaeon]
MRVVVKIGTSTLTKSGKIDTEYIKGISEEVAGLVRNGKEIVIVSSGAIGFGAMKSGIKDTRGIVKRQSLAAIGQIILMKEYEKAFSVQGIDIAQILLTYDVLSNRKSYLNLKNCMEMLLKNKVVPIINENDVVSIDEIGTAFGDNDVMSALVSTKIDADLLIILSDIDGLYDDNPKKNSDARKIKVVSKIDNEIESYAGKAGSFFSVGGMKSKIRAASIVMKSGSTMAIAEGREKKVISRIIEGENPGTIFLPSEKLNARKRWILAAKPKGKISINECAIEIMKDGKSSLLPVGVVNVEGNFSQGDVVKIGSFAKGISLLSASEMRKVKGLKSKEASAALGRKVSEIVRRDDIVPC